MSTGDINVAMISLNLVQSAVDRTTDALCGETFISRSSGVLVVHCDDSALNGLGCLSKRGNMYRTALPTCTVQKNYVWYFMKVLQ